MESISPCYYCQKRASFKTGCVIKLTVGPISPRGPVVPGGPVGPCDYKTEALIKSLMVSNLGQTHLKVTVKREKYDKKSEAGRQHGFVEIN